MGPFFYIFTALGVTAGITLTFNDMKRIRAKFECTQVIPAHGGYETMAHLSAVIGNKDGSDNEENKSFSSATPYGQITIGISPDVPAHKFFRVGREYYLDFTRVPLAESTEEE